jgi:hypothetical protein
MIPGMLEKFSYVATLAVLYAQGRIAQVDALAAVPDGLLALLFIVAFVKTSLQSAAAPRSRWPWDSRCIMRPFTAFTIGDRSHCS